MAKRVYYGTCKSGSREEQKKVYVPDTDININKKFNFEKGDLLVVFFAQKNDADEPSIVVYIQDSEQESSIIIDSGKFIKTLDVEAGLADAWDAGETVIFVYTQQDTSKEYYWELVDAAHATTTIYGNTKLFDVANLEELLASDTVSEEYSELALTPIALKKFWDLIQPTNSEESGGQGDQGDQGDQQQYGLQWFVSEDIPADTLDVLGTLTLTKEDQGVKITYPIRALIEQYIPEIKTITHTGQLYNNGNGAIDNPVDETTEPFITRMVPNNLYFNNGNGLYYSYTTPDTIWWGMLEIPNPNAGQTISVPRIILNDSNNNIVIGQNNDDSLSGIVINKPTKIGGKTNVIGPLVVEASENFIPQNQIGGNGSITASGTIISTNGNVAGLTLYEGKRPEDGGWWPLREKYSPLLQVVARSTGTIDIGKHGSVDHWTLDANNVSGWTPLCVVGYNINYAKDSSKSDARYGNVWECFLRESDKKIQYAVYNLRDSAISINITFYVLYKKNI